MKLILTDDIRNIPDGLPSDYHVQAVDRKSIKQYDGNNEVEVVLCTRALARELQLIKLPSCKLVQLFSVGYDDIDLNYYKNNAIPLCNASGIYDNVLAEYVVFAMLLNAKRFNRSIKNWMFRPFRNYHYMTEIAGKTVGIMGCGRIGTAVANHLTGFGVSIIGYAKQTTEKDGFVKIYHEDTIYVFFGECDYVVNTLPHDESTIGLINKHVLNSAKPTMTFINIGRDSIFSGDDFYNFMKSHKDATAILDMFELIPNPFTNKYHRLRNVMVMPRIAAISQESEEHIKKLIVRNMQAANFGGILENRIV